MAEGAAYLYDVTGDLYLDKIKTNLTKGRKQWRRGDNLLAAFGYQRRRQIAIDLINSRLKAKRLVTVPKLTTDMPLDRGITFYLRGARRTKAKSVPAHGNNQHPVEVVTLAGDDEDHGSGHPVTVPVPVEPPPADPGGATERYIVGNLASAEKTPEQIAPTATIREALTVMALNDYSQLVVTTSPREVKGIISYKSIATATLQGQPTTVNDCIDPDVPTVKLDEPLFRVAEMFSAHDVVLVLRPDRTLSGIVTPADIVDEFGVIAAPVLLIGQIEEQLRWLVQEKLDLSKAFADERGSSSERVRITAADLTMGELHRLLDNDRNWGKVGIKFDRTEFCKELNLVRDIRNAVMHFRELPDGGADRLKRFANVVQMAYLALAT